MTDTIAEIRARHEAAEKDGGHEWCGVHGPAAHADRAVLLARVAELEAWRTQVLAAQNIWIISRAIGDPDIEIKHAQALAQTIASKLSGLKEAP